MAGKKDESGHAYPAHWRWRPGDPTEYDTAGVDPDIAARLMQLVSPRRFLHCKRVADFAVSLARRWELNEDHARRAGLLHDVRREQAEPWPELAAREGIPLPDWAMSDWTLIHGPLGAKLAEREFPLPRPWLDGIANHSWCRAGATPEELVVYIADHACEGRRYPNVERYRELAFTSMERAAHLILTDLLQHLLNDNHPLWPPAVEARNALILKLHGGAGAERAQRARPPEESLGVQGSAASPAGGASASVTEQPLPRDSAVPAAPTQDPSARRSSPPLPTHL